MARKGRPPMGPAESGGEPQRLTADEELELALQVAQAYYLENESKVRIAERLGITRFQAARLLTLARETGMVHIEVRAPRGIDRELSAQLQMLLGIPRAIVVTTMAGSSSLDDVGFTLARTLSEVVSVGDYVGLTWSRATIAMSQQLADLQPCSLVQLGGHVEGVGVGMPGTSEIVQRAAQQSGGQAYPIYAPLVVNDAHTAESLREQPTIKAAMELYSRLDVAVLSVGAWVPSGSTIYDTIPEPVRQAASAAGAVGEVGGRLFDRSGKPMRDVLDDRVIGISLDQLRDVPQIITTSYGAYRAEATRAAVKAGVVTTLIADRDLAVAILGD